MEWLAYWHWLALGLLLLVAESLGAAGFLMAFSVAALLTGALTLIWPMGWQWQLLLFSVLSLISTYGWWWWLSKRAKPSEQPNLNRPLHGFIGRTTRVTQAIEDGRGKVRLNDANWFVTGPDAALGSQVTVIGVEGSLLMVSLAAADENAVSAAPRTDAEDAQPGT